MKDTVRLQSVRCETWHGFLFVNLDADALPVGTVLRKVEPYWEGYDEAELVTVPPVPSGKTFPWNWKLHFENFTDAYHPEFVHRGTHDFAPSVHADGGVRFFDFEPEEQAIIRTVPLLKPDGGMMNEGWGEAAAFRRLKRSAPSSADALHSS